MDSEPNPRVGAAPRNINYTGKCTEVHSFESRACSIIVNRWLTIPCHDYGKQRNAAENCCQQQTRPCAPREPPSGLVTIHGVKTLKNIPRLPRTHTGVLSHLAAVVLRSGVLGGDQTMSKGAELNVAHDEFSPGFSSALEPGTCRGDPESAGFSRARAETLPRR